MFVTLCGCKGFRFKWTCRWAFYFLAHSIILFSGHMENYIYVKKAQRTKWHWNTASNLSYVTFCGRFCEYLRCLFAEFSVVFLVSTDLKRESSRVWNWNWNRICLEFSKFSLSICLKQNLPNIKNTNNFLFASNIFRYSDPSVCTIFHTMLPFKMISKCN